MFDKFRSIYIIILILFTVIDCQLNYKQLYQTGSACVNGRSQSPISLSEDISSFNATVNLLYDTYNIINNTKLRFDERILYVSHDNESESIGYITLSRNGILKKYALKRIELSYPGEHKINNITTNLEIKFIHEQVMSFETDVNQYRKLIDSNTNLIVSIMYNTTSLISDNGFITNLLDTFGGSPIKLNIDSYDLIRDRQFYFYEGSFTYNPCNENVNYIVISKPFYLGETQKSILDGWFSSRYDDGNTAKAIAQLNGRDVYRNYATERDLSGGNVLSITLLILFMLIIL